jgi:hypothetical protein
MVIAFLAAHRDPSTPLRFAQDDWIFAIQPSSFLRAFVIRASSFSSSPLAERTVFGFVIFHGHATHLVRSVGF